eukprot:scaffold46425_cov55-Attheya_sp.AAC.4
MGYPAACASSPIVGSLYSPLSTPSGMSQGASRLHLSFHDFTCGGGCAGDSAAILSRHVRVDGIGKYIWIVDGGGAVGVRIGGFASEYEPHGQAGE